MVQRSGLNDVIAQTIHQLECRSQLQEPLQMATSSSSATITGIYSTGQLQRGNGAGGPTDSADNLRDSQQQISINQPQSNAPSQANQYMPQKVISKLESGSNRRHHHHQ